MQRLLLIELAATDRFHRGVAFPYLFGFARRASVPARWLRCAVSARDGVALDDDASAYVRAALDDFAPTRVVLNNWPTPELLDAIRRALPDGEVVTLGMPYAPDASAPLPPLGSGSRAWAAFLGVRGDDLLLPDYGFEPAHDAARQMQPLPFMILGDECTYNRSLASNPVFADVDLSECVRTGGCSFCARSDNADRGVPPFSIEGARAQLQALADTHPPAAGRMALRLNGEPALFHIEEIVHIVGELRLPPMDLLFDGRTDRLVERASSLRRAAEKAGPHSLHIALVGIENFARPELERMNKGIDPLTNLEAIDVLLALERDLPGRFALRKYGGLSTILFSPWTTLEDLTFNLRVVQGCGLEGLSGKLLGARLRLDPGLALTALAHRDGLLVEGYDDAALDTAARNLYGAELPWRFADERVGPICQLLIRLTGAIDDPLARTVEAVATRARQRGWSRLDLAVDLAERARAGLRPEALLAEVTRVWPSEPPGRSYTSQEAWVTCDDRMAEFIALTVELSRAGVKPVSKIEPLRPNEVDAAIARHRLPNARVRLRAQASPPAAEIFHGHDAELVEEARRLTDQRDRSARDSPAAAAEVGKLLGYPACCAEAFSHEQSAHDRDSYGWMHLALRVAHRGAVPPELNPWAAWMASQYIPCGLDCAASRTFAARVAEVARRVQSEAAFTETERRMRNPWLVVLRGQGSAIELMPEDEPGERFRYRPGATTGNARELEHIAAADELVLEPERLLLRNHGEQVADLSARAFVWWHERALQAEFWSRVVALREHSFGAADHSSGGAIALEPETLELESRLLSALRDFGGHWTLTSASPTRLVLNLAPEVTLFVTAARTTEKSLFSVGPFAFSHPREQPLDTESSRHTVESLRHHLAAHEANTP